METEGTLFLCCLEKIALENITDAESPLRENETYQLELKVDSLYALHNIDTEERVDIYNYIALLKPTFSDFPNFCLMCMINFQRNLFDNPIFS